MTKLRVLILTNRWYVNGGVENFIRQLVSETHDAIDYIVASLITEVENDLPCQIIGPVIPSKRISGIYTAANSIVDVLRSVHCDVVHIQASNGAAFFLAHLAEKAGIPKRIVHSHNAGGETTANSAKSLAAKVTAFVFSNAPTDLWACSSGAGRYLFGNRDFRVLYNGIDIERFAFSQEKRNRARCDLGIPDDAFLLGSIGRISLQKNPIFQLRVFRELRKLIPDARFCMVGSGDLEAERDAELEKLELGDSVVVVPCTSDSDAFYSAFDALLFPPLFEGLSFVGIESQCSGLPVYASTAVPYELDVTDRIVFLSLDEDPLVWADWICKGFRIYGISERAKYAEKIRSAGFERGECFGKIAKAYMERES